MYSQPAVLKRKTLSVLFLAITLFFIVTKQVVATQDAKDKATSHNFLAMHEVITILKKQGFHTIREIEVEEGSIYEINARDQRNQKVEIDMDAVTGAIISIEDD